MEKQKTIKPIVRLDETGKKVPEDRLYLILFSYFDDSTSWKIILGREESYEAVKIEIVNGYVDIHESFILVEGNEFGTEVSLYEFMKHMENFFKDPDFDIEDYSYDLEPVDNIEPDDVIDGEYDIESAPLGMTIDNLTDDSEEI